MQKAQTILSKADTRVHIPNNLAASSLAWSPVPVYNLSLINEGLTKHDSVLPRATIPTMHIQPCSIRLNVSLLNIGIVCCKKTWH